LEESKVHAIGSRANMESKSDNVSSYTSAQQSNNHDNQFSANIDMLSGGDSKSLAMAGKKAVHVKVRRK
jgi:hypothetical protein